MSDFFWQEYALDQRINDRSFRIDRRLVSEALRIDALSRVDLTAGMKKRTGLDNPNSVLQMREYLAEVLSLRLQLAKSSVRKYQAMAY